MPSPSNQTPTDVSRTPGDAGAAPRRLVPHFLTGFLFLIVLVLAGCTSATGLPIAALPAEENYGGAIQSALAYRVPATPTPVPADEELQVIVSTEGSRANVRSGPGLNAAIIAKADPGQAFQVLGKSEDEGWWQICCVEGPNDAEGQPTTEGWLSDSVVRLAGEGDAVTVASSEPVVRDDLTAQWDVDWSCDSEEGRCTLDQCQAVVTAAVNRASDGQFIPVEYQVEWADECFSTDSWVLQVDPLTGEERTGAYKDNFLYAYWGGANGKETSGVFPFGDDGGIVVACKGPQTVEIEEGEGWTSVYEGVTCHDKKTGLLVYMDYVKRWLFTGEFEGKQYERAYFGDMEKLEQRLTDTNVDLFVVEKR